MSNEPTSRKPESQSRTAGRVDTKLEVVVLPVSDVDRAKGFYAGLGWRLDADFTTGPDFRVGRADAARLAVLDHLRHGRHRGRRRAPSKELMLVVDDIEERAQRAHGPRGRCQRGVPRRSRRSLPSRRQRRDAFRAQIRSAARTARGRRSKIRTAMAGCSRRSRRDCPDACGRSTRNARRSCSGRPSSSSAGHPESASRRPDGRAPRAPR